MESRSASPVYNTKSSSTKLSIRLSDPRVTRLTASAFSLCQAISRMQWFLSARAACPLPRMVSHDTGCSPRSAVLGLRERQKLALTLTRAIAGHYVALVKNGDKWLLFEDESVELVNEGVVQSVFGSSQVRSERDTIRSLLSSTPTIYTNKYEQPNDIHHMPIPSSSFKSKMMFISKMELYQTS